MEKEKDLFSKEGKRYAQNGTKTSPLLPSPGKGEKKGVQKTFRFNGEQKEPEMPHILVPLLEKLLLEGRSIGEKERGGLARAGIEASCLFERKKGDRLRRRTARREKGERPNLVAEERGGRA